MMSKKITQLIFIFSFLISLLIAASYYIKTEQFENDRSNFENQTYFLKNEIEAIKEYYKLNLKNSKNKCLKNIQIINENGDLITLKSEVKRKKDNLIVLFSKSNCDDCVKNQIKIIDQNIPHKIILTDYQTINEIRIIKRLYNINDEIYRIYDQTEIEEFQVYKELPIIFFIDENLNILSSLIVYKHLIDFTQIYIDEFI